MSQPMQPNRTLLRAAVAGALLAMALGLRLWGIDEESFWLDEAISVQCSEGSIAAVLERNARDVRPPLYYMGLHLWRSVLGDTDARIRAYSAVWSLVGILAVFLLARDIAGWRAAVIALLLAALNPLDVYFAQEARNYSQTAALGTFGSWCLWRWMAGVSDHSRLRRWYGWAIAYTACAIALVYSHFLGVCILVAQGLFVLVWFGLRRQWASIAAYLVCAAVVALGFLPWFWLVARAGAGAALRFPDWLQEPAWSTYVSFLGREFIWGRVYTIPRPWWILTMVPPVLVVCIGLWRAYQVRVPDGAGRHDLGRTAYLYPLWLLAGPVVLAAVFGAVYKPIYFRPRFAMLVLHPFVILAALAFTSFRSRTATRLATAGLGLLMLTGTVGQRRAVLKVDWRSFATAWRRHGPPSQIVFFPKGLETIASYYVGRDIVPANRERLERLLRYLASAEIWICSKAEYGYHAAPAEAEFRKWLLGLGTVREIPLPTGLHIQAVRVSQRDVAHPAAERFDQWFVPVDVNGEIEGFDETSGFSGLEFTGPGGAPCRWSGPKAWFCLRNSGAASTVTLSAAMPPPVVTGYRPEFAVSAQRGTTADGLFASSPVVRIDAYRAEPLEISIPAPDGAGPLWIGWTINPVNLAEAGVSGDDRDLGLRLLWVGVRNRENEGAWRTDR